MSSLVTFGLPPVSGAGASGQHDDLARLLERRLDRSVIVRVAASYSELADSLAEGQVDFAWLPPLDAAQLRDHTGVHVVLQSRRGSGGDYQSVLFVREDSPLTELAQLDAADIGFVHRRSASGYLVAAAYLRASGVHPSAPPRFLGSHGAVVQAVADGTVTAGATYGHLASQPGATPSLVAAGWTQYAPEPACPMRALAWAGPIPADAVCAWPGTSQSARDALRTALLDATDDPEESAVLASVFGTRGFEPFEGGAYDLLNRSLAALSRRTFEHQ